MGNAISSAFFDRRDKKEPFSIRIKHKQEEEEGEEEVVVAAPPPSGNFCRFATTIKKERDNGN